jgi:hypothetical protein
MSWRLRVRVIIRRWQARRDCRQGRHSPLTIGAPLRGRMSVLHDDIIPEKWPVVSKRCIWCGKDLM